MGSPVAIEDKPMPLAEMTMTRGALPEHSIGLLAQEITNILLDHQGARPGSEAASAITCLEITEVEPTRLFFGGVPVGDNRYRVKFTIPSGAMSLERKSSLVEAVTRTVLAAEGTPWSEADAMRVWCIVSEIPDGNWASGGRIYRWREIVRWVMRTDIAIRRAMAGVRDRELTHS